MSDRKVARQGSQKYLLAVLFGACILLGVCNAACMVSRPPELKDGERLEGCKYNGNVYELGSKFEMKCLDCDCRSNGLVSCCTKPECMKQHIVEY